MSKKIKTDIAIFGGGVAGLWLLNVLINKGFSAILFESNKLGGGQTHKAQGIIHGGTKYALQGTVTAATNAIADMPNLWQNCLNGDGEIDLTKVPVLSKYQYLFSTNKLAGKLAGFFAGMALQGKVDTLVPKDYPAIFKHKNFKGVVYALNEMAIDTHVLIAELAKPVHKNIFKIEGLHSDDLIFKNDCLEKIKLKNGNDFVEIEAKKFVFTAGAGNELILKKLNRPHLNAQRRPLHMVLMKTDLDFSVFAHCLGVSATPRITITTHEAQDGKKIWYLGGQISEEGVKYDSETQIQIAKKELANIFSWLDFSSATFASFLIDRAEPSQPGGKRPDSAYFESIGNIIVAWPTKLALAPKLANEIINSLHGMTKEKNNLQHLRMFQEPQLAQPIWEELL